MSSFAEAQSSVIFSRFQTTSDLPLSKLGEKTVHQHDLVFAQQVAARVLAAGDPINPYIVKMGDVDASGNLRSAHLNTGVYDDASATPQPYAANSHSAADGSTATLGESTAKGYSTAVPANDEKKLQINWENASANILGSYQGRHTLRLSDFLAVFYPDDTNEAGATPVESNLQKAKLVDKHNQSEAGPRGWFGVNTANEMKVIEDGVEVASTAQKNDSGVAGGVQETKGVVLTHIDSNSKNSLGFNVQNQVLTNILSDLGVDVRAENESAKSLAADKLDSSSYIKLANFLGSHDNLAKVVEVSSVSSEDAMTRDKLFVELAKQYDVQNKVYEAKPVQEKIYTDASDVTGTDTNLKSVTKAVNEVLERSDGLTQKDKNKNAQTILENVFTDRSAYASGRVAVAFLYKSQTPGVKSTEVRVHMKVSGGKVTVAQGGSSAIWPKYVKTNDVIGRTWDQMCTPLPLMEDGKAIRIGVVTPA